MAAPAAARRYTVDDLAGFPDDGRRRELADGRIVEWGVTNFRHGYVLAVLTHLLTAFVLERGLGAVVGGDVMVRILGSAGDARGADIAFYAAGRIPDDIEAGLRDRAPDLAVEILSPTDRAGEVQEKVRDWLRAGVKLLWYVNPVTGTTTVHQGERATFVGPDEPLDGRDVLPGFTLRLSDVLDKVAALKAADSAGR